MEERELAKTYKKATPYMSGKKWRELSRFFKSTLENQPRKEKKYRKRLIIKYINCPIDIRKEISKLL